MRENNLSNKPLNAELIYNNIKRDMDMGIGRDRVLIVLDFNHFNYINDLFGYETGDEVLARVTAYFSTVLNAGESCSRIHADNFVFWIKRADTDRLIERVKTLIAYGTVLSDLLPRHYSLVSCAGIVCADMPNETLSSLLDKANFARKIAKHSESSAYVFYDEKLDEELKWRKMITLNMESALDDGEFVMYLQPKIEFRTKRIVGAEALVRWKNKTLGMIMPDRFIPIMEQNGFVKQLDYFMLSQACRFLKKLETEQLKKIPISVNFSKVHLKSQDFAEQVAQTAAQEHVETSYLELELTENMFFKDYEAMVDFATKLKTFGFKVSLDDFGSAYSSLNYLKELPVDIIKIDKGFLDAATDTKKGRTIITKMVELIRSLRMVSVMEGVETEEQARFLDGLGCDLGQGYYYARPMPAEDFLEILKQQRGKYGESSNDQNSSTDTSYQANGARLDLSATELYALGESLEMGIYKEYLDTNEMIYLNECAESYFGYSLLEIRETFHNRLFDLLLEDDKTKMRHFLFKLVKDRLPVNFDVRAVRKDGKIIHLRGRSICIRDEEGRFIGLHIFSDVTEEVEGFLELNLQLESKVKILEQAIATERANREALKISEARYRLILEQSEGVAFDFDFSTNRFKFTASDSVAFPLLCGERCACYMLEETIHPNDRQTFQNWLDELKSGLEDKTSADFRLKTADGYVWMRVRSTVMRGENHEAYGAIGVFTNITQEKNEIDHLTEKAQLDPLTRLLNKEETRRRVEAFLCDNPNVKAAFMMMDLDNFKGVNDSLGHQFGDTVLREVALKLQQSFCDGEILGRLGGDEFVIFSEVQEEKRLKEKLDALIASMRASYFGESTKYDVSASVGVAMYPTDGKRFDDLYKLSDTALYESKRLDKNCYTFYHENMTVNAANDQHAPVEFVDRFLSKYFESDFIYNVFELLYETKEVSTTVQKILELAGNRFKVERVYIFENSADGTTTSNTYEWCAPGVVEEKESLQNLPVDDMKHFFSAYGKEGILACGDIGSMDDYSYQILSRQGIKSFLHCAISNAGKRSGFIGYDVCSEHRVWRGDEIAMLGYLSRILSVYLWKQQIMRELVQSNRNYEELLDSMNGYVYLIDLETYDILFMNKTMRETGVKMGAKCYREAFGEDSPCHNCPAKQLSRSKTSCTEEIFSMVLNKWVMSSASLMKWNGKDAGLVCCVDISNYKG